MSGLEEIQQWVEANIDLSKFDNVDDAYNRINDPKRQDWRNDLDDILQDDKSRFLDWLESKITPTQTEPPEAEPTGFIKIRAYSYIRNGKVVNVPSHQRRKRK